MLKLRGVTVHLFPDGDWKMASAEEGVYRRCLKECNTGKVEDACHQLLQCST